MEKRNILITGGAGFIGSHVVELMTTKYPHYHIVTLDKLTYAGSVDNIAEAMKRPNHTFIEGDICDTALVERIFTDYNIDGVMHLAAESHVDRSISAPMLFAMNNILGTITLLEAARKAWAGDYEGKRFHHISTDEVYGALPLEGGKFTEESRYEPHSPYSASKASSDHFVRAYHDTYGLPAVITNCSNNYGERQYPEKLITSLSACRCLSMAQDATYVTGYMLATMPRLSMLCSTAVPMAKHTMWEEIMSGQTSSL